MLQIEKQHVVLAGLCTSSRNVQLDQTILISGIVN